MQLMSQLVMESESTDLDWTDMHRQTEVGAREHSRANCTANSKYSVTAPYKSCNLFYA